MKISQVVKMLDLGQKANRPLKLNVLGTNQTEISLDSKRVFFSYNTPVAAWLAGVGYIRTSTKYSVTTSKHITRWLAGENAKFVPQSEIDAILA